MRNLNLDPPPPSSAPGHAHVFPPALIPILRERVGDSVPCLANVSDEVLGELLTAVFFASLETHEGTYYPVRVAFSGPLTADVLLPEGDAQDATPMLLYRWSTVRFVHERSFSVPELVRLGVVTRSERMYAKVELTPRGLALAGLAREGSNDGGDPYLKILAHNPGFLTVERGDERVLEYTHGRIAAAAEDVIVAPGRVRRALEACARNAELGDDSLLDYLSTVRSVVREMAAHGRGGILVVSPDSRPPLPVGAAYDTQDDGTMGQLLQFLDGSASGQRPSGPVPRGPRGGAAQLRRFLRSAFSNEADRIVSQLGGFTAMDGATVLDCALGLRGFGVVLPVAREVEVLEALDLEGERLEPFELSTRGTRHRAAVTYAEACAGSVVFVASHDGPLSCALRTEGSDRVLIWRAGGTLG
ncbi:MAG TPA: hypothetical protein VMI54_13875 [Polyangiaceae bacterium]|nr:hypothetical protein [Polyangiaceae bacterium]